jgi:hypothetical protein
MQLFFWVMDVWCELKHPLPRRPVNGFSECPRCLRKRPLNWHKPG